MASDLDALINMPSDLNLARFLEDVSEDYPRRRSASIHERCDVIDAGDG